MLGLEIRRPDATIVEEWTSPNLTLGENSANDLVVAGLGLVAVRFDLTGGVGQLSQAVPVERNGGRQMTRELASGDTIVGPGASVCITWHDVGELVASQSIRDLPTVAEAPLPGDAAARLVQALRVLGQAVDRPTALRNILAAVYALSPVASHALILLRDNKEPNRFTLAASQVRDGSTETVRASRSVLRNVLATGGAVLTRIDDDNTPSSESMIATNMQSVLAVPLWRGDEIIGIIHTDNRSVKSVFTERDLGPMMLLAANASLALENADLIARLREAEARLQRENTYLKSRAKARDSQLIAEAPAMKAVLAQLAKVVATRATVCIMGETGTGKELIAATLHATSPRAEQLFVAQNCAAIPENLLESVLFGHTRGSFTGADADKKGLFEMADGGTLFLDEIGEMPMALQAKLLRVLQEGTIRPVGANTEREVNVRIVCATHRDLAEDAKAGRFRSDLFYRLMVFPIALPPLRERREDIRPLAEHFLAKYSREMRVATPTLAPDALTALMSYAWPGNIRELENEMQRVLIAAESDEVITLADLAPRFRLAQSHPIGLDAPGATLKDRMDFVERNFLVEALREHGGNKTKTAAALGMTREGLHKKLARFGI